MTTVAIVVLIVGGIAACIVIILLLEPITSAEQRAIDDDRCQATDTDYRPAPIDERCLRLEAAYARPAATRRNTGGRPTT